MLRDEVGIVFCGTRRAKGWQRALAARGIEARVTETFGEDSEAGAYKVSVARRDLPRANELMTRVTRGEVTLPGEGASWRVLVAVLAIAGVVAALVLR